MPTRHQSSRHQASLSDDGVDDNDLLGIEDPDRHASTDIEGTLGTRSSPASRNQPETTWQFDDPAVSMLSSVADHVEDMPETVPVPTQPEQLQLQDADKTFPSIEMLGIDASETCSTTRRSSPCGFGNTQPSWDFGDGDSDESETSHSRDMESANKEKSTNKGKSTNETQSAKDAPPAKEPRSKKETRPTKPPQPARDVPATNTTKKLSPNKKPEETAAKTYNIRPKRKISYADDGSSEVDEQLEAEAVSAQKQAPERSTRRDNADTRKDTNRKQESRKETSSTAKSPQQSPAQTSSDSAVGQQKRRPKQRAKPTLSFDESTQTIKNKHAKLNLSEAQKNTKRQKNTYTAAVAPSRQTRQDNSRPVPKPPVTANRPRERHAQKENTEKPRIDPSFDDTSEQMRSSSLGMEDAANKRPSPEEEPDDSSETDSTHSTDLTSPSIAKSPIKKTQPEPQKPKTIVPQVPLFSTFGQRPGAQHAQETARQRLSDLSVAIPKATQRVENNMAAQIREIETVRCMAVSKTITNHMQAIDKHLEDKAKDLELIISVYKKNGLSCVNRIWDRYTREHQQLAAQTRHDAKVSVASSKPAIRLLRDGRKDRERVMKHISRNIRRRSKVASSDVQKLNDMAKKIYGDV